MKKLIITLLMLPAIAFADEKKKASDSTKKAPQVIVTTQFIFNEQEMGQLLQVQKEIGIREGLLSELIINSRKQVADTIR